MIIDVAIFCKAQIQHNVETKTYSIPLYNVEDGKFWYIGEISADMYNEYIVPLDNKPRHLFFSGILYDVPIMEDYLGLVNESRQRIHINTMKILLSDIYVPESLKEELIETIVPYQFISGPSNGYYLVVLNEQENATFHAVSNVDVETGGEHFEQDATVEYDLFGEEQQEDFDHAIGVQLEKVSVDKGKGKLQPSVVIRPPNVLHSVSAKVWAEGQVAGLSEESDTEPSGSNLKRVRSVESEDSKAKRLLSSFVKKYKKN
ncbi:hypothetical protein INT46_008031 [Mucor plumbeus]|uniref:Uncharacterized protein n=1 Tax=Mucor plumbeus TaxID=97098 RepID=A0A8H7UP53_9FUNG|nr:hypothetical protein INT46_008031 [Mucor plumbeus]